MSDKIFIDVHSSRKRVALTQDDDLVEFYVERTMRQKCVGNIYRGKVINVVSGMSAAFVDIGLNKNAYLYVGGTPLLGGELEDINCREESDGISAAVGDEIMVQVVKDESGTKGARITQDASVAGRFLVYMPTVEYVGISRKIEDEGIREKLHKLVSGLTPSGSGFVVRTAAATATPKEIKQDAKFLIDTFSSIKKDYEAATAPTKVYEDGDLVFRTIRDMYTASVGEIITNDSECYEYLKGILKKVAPSNKTTITLYTQSADMFKNFKLDLKVEALLKRRVTLKNGAYLIIDKTEALTVIDVNTGRYVGNGTALEDTVYITNMLAAREIARQIRLRNIGGIIITDFIDMIMDEHRAAVLLELQNELKKDRIKTNLVGMTGLGLVEITRKKTINDAQTLLMQACPFCSGDGVVYSYDYLIMKMRCELLDCFKAGAMAVTVELHPFAVDAVFSSKILSDDCEKLWGDKMIYVIPQPRLNVDKFEINMLSGEVYSLPNNARLLY